MKQQTPDDEPRPVRFNITENNPPPISAASMRCKQCSPKCRNCSAKCTPKPQTDND